MAKFLTEEEYNALLADHDRLEWCVKHRAEWAAKLGELWYDWVGETPKVMRGDSIFEAIDKARGAA